MHTFKTTVGKYNVDLYFRDDATLPHGFEVTTGSTTNDGGYFRQGSLGWEGNTLVDYDGCFELPAAVKTALQQIPARVAFDQYV